MDEWDKTEEETVRRLLEEAGPRPPIPQEDLEAIAIAARFAWQAQVHNKARRSLRPYVAALAAALAVAIGLSVWWAMRTPPVPPTVAWVEEVAGPVHLGDRVLVEGDPVPLGSTLRSDGRASLRLPDGATVRLDEKSRLRLASASLLELERGGLYVDTGSGPLEVRTPVGTVRDVGTQFALRVSDASLLVKVRDGAVLTEQRGRTWRTEAGQELLLRPDGTSETRATAGHGPGWDWILEASPGFDIEGRSLRDFLDWVSRETGWKVVLPDSAGEIVLHGSLGELRPDQAPFAVLPGAGLEGKLEDGALVVRPRSPR